MYYVIEIAKGDAKIAGKGIYEYQTLEEAIGAWHAKLGTAMRSSLYESDLCMVAGDGGEVYRSEYYTKPVFPEAEE